MSRVRLRRLQQSDWVVVTEDSVRMGLAAYKRVHSDVRVVHELLIDQTLPVPDAERVTGALIDALEILALDEGVDCLMFMLFHDVVITRFTSRGYSVIVADQCGAWLQKKLDGLAWARNSPCRSSQ